MSAVLAFQATQLRLQCIELGPGTCQQFDLDIEFLACHQIHAAEGIAHHCLGIALKIGSRTACYQV